MASRNIDIVINANDKASKEINKVKKEVKGFSEQFKSTFGAIASLQIFDKALEGISAGVRTITEDFVNMQNQLRQVTSGEGLGQLTKDLEALSNRARTPILETTSAFVRFDKAIQGAGGSQAESLLVTENLAKGLSLSGASAMEAGSAMLQLSQAFGSGVLQGDEFRSLSESMPMLLDLIAKQMGVTRGELKQLGADGKITSQVLKEALIGATDQINEAFNNSQKTIGQAMTILKNKLLVSFGDLGTQLTEQFVSLIDSIVKYWDENGKQIVFSIGEDIKSIVSFFQEGFSGIVSIFENTFSFFEDRSQESTKNSLLSFQGFLLALSLGLDSIKLAFKVIGAFILYQFENAFYSTQIAFAKLKQFIGGMSSAIGASISFVAQNIGVAFNNGVFGAIKAINWLIEGINKIPGINIEKIGQSFKYMTAVSLSEVNAQAQGSIEAYNKAGDEIIAMEKHKSEMLGYLNEATAEMIKGSVDAMSEKYQEFINKGKETAQSGKTLQQTLDDIKNAGITGGNAVADAGKKGKEAVDKLKKSIDELKEGASKAYSDITDKILKQKDKIVSLSEDYLKMKEKLKEMRESGVEEVQKLTDKLNELKDKGIENITKLEEKIQELKKQLSESQTTGIEDIAKRAIEAQQELDKLKEKGVNLNLAQSLGENLNIIPDSAIIGTSTVEDLKKALALQNEIALAKKNITDEDIKNAKLELNKSETQKIIDRMEKEKEEIDLKVANIEVEITAQKKKNDEELANQQRIIDKKIADNKAEEDSYITLMNTKKTELINEKTLYESLIKDKQTLEKTYFETFSQQVKTQMTEIQSVINKMNELKNKSGVNTSISTTGTNNNIGINTPNINTASGTNQLSSGGNTININFGGIVVSKEADENRLIEKIKKALTNEAKNYNIGIS